MIHRHFLWLATCTHTRKFPNVQGDCLPPRYSPGLPRKNRPTTDSNTSKPFTRRDTCNIWRAYSRAGRISKVPHKEVIPGVHPDRRECGYPASAEGQAAFHHADLSCPIGANTWRGVLWSAHTAAHAAHLALNGNSACYALSRPSGHHAAKDYAAGFCYLGNTAICPMNWARTCRRFSRDSCSVINDKRENSSLGLINDMVAFAITRRRRKHE